MIDNAISSLVKFIRNLWLIPQVVLIITTSIWFVVFYFGGTMWMKDVPLQTILTMLQKASILWFVNFVVLLLVSRIAGWYDSN